MSNKPLIELLREADRGGYGINSFNFSDIWDLQAIVRAAEDEKAPVMLMAHPENFSQESLGMCAAMALQAAKEASVPVYLHLDHSPSVDICKAAVDMGFPSVMIDGSSKSLKENIRMTKEVVDYAHSAGVIVEAEMGRIKGGGIEGGYYGDDFLAQVSDCVALAEESGCDTLAVGIGTAHGFYTEEPKLNFERLNEINEALSIPLVLHGGTGVPAADVQKAIKNGINKVNVGTCVATTYMIAMRDELNKADDAPFVIDVVPPVIDRVKDVVKEWIGVCMSAGKA